MKSIRQICAATFLVGALTYTTFAGEMNYPIVQPPPSQLQQVSLATEETNVVSSQSSDNIVINVVMSVLQTVSILP